ncbi:hypothetical protein GCM10009560_40640 [Nonomuraea longicatena]|uniref:Transposase n=1 Tax=Nonomuraea longicatena TaxID=83682 RepID=A0ABN1PWB3_9ACTN
MRRRTLPQLDLHPVAEMFPDDLERLIHHLPRQLSGHLFGNGENGTGDRPGGHHLTGETPGRGYSRLAWCEGRREKGVG